MKRPVTIHYRCVNCGTPYAGEWDTGNLAVPEIHTVCPNCGSPVRIYLGQTSLPAVRIPLEGSGHVVAPVQRRH